jgi:hypothetical protein
MTVHQVYLNATSYQHVINLTVSLTVGRGPGLFVKVPVWEHHTLNNQIFLCGEVYYSNTITITILMQTLIPNCQFENILSPQFCIKISKQNCHVVLLS